MIVLYAARPARMSSSIGCGRNRRTVVTAPRCNGRAGLYAGSGIFSPGRGYRLVRFRLPLIVMQNPHPPFHLLELPVSFLWMVAVTGEAMADWQLASFGVSHGIGTACAGKGCGTTRDTPPLFEWLHWWSYVVMGTGEPAGQLGLTLIGPLTMGWALLKVTGIPWTETHTMSSRGREYAEYQRTTNAFIPWPPVRSGAGEVHRRSVPGEFRQPCPCGLGGGCPDSDG